MPYKYFTCYLIGFIIVIGWSSCNNSDMVPGEFITLDNTEWQYGKTLKFNQNRDTLPGLVDAIALSLRHSNEYPYANLWVELSYRSQDSITSDTFNIFLADEYGKWHGNGSGPVVTFTDTLRPRHFPDDGTVFMLRHVMRVDVLPEIEQIGMAFHTVPRPEITPAAVIADSLMLQTQSNVE